MSPTRPWSLVDAYAGFIASIEGGERLLGLINDLFAAAHPEDFRRALTSILAQLGHEIAPVEESARLVSQEVLQRVTCIARYGRFAISLVELKYPQHYPSTLAPVFRLHPDGIVFTFSPHFKTSSVVFSAPSPSGTRLVQRILIGRGAGLDLRDTLLVWLWRLSSLRPRYEDDARTLAARASECLRCPADQIDTRWPDVHSSWSASKPGLGWTESLGWSQRGFLEAGAAGWIWGLERVLRNAFPIFSADRQAHLDYSRFELLGEPTTHPTALTREGHRLQSIRLHLLHSDGAGEPADEISVDCNLPVADGAGRFLLGGAWSRFAPRVDAHGAVLRDSCNRSREVHSEDDVEPRGRASLTFYGASLGTFLEIAVARKLGGVRHTIMRRSEELPSLRACLHRALRRASGPLGRPILCSLVFMRERLLQLAPQAPAMRVPSLVAAGHPPEVPPAWCCPEVGREHPLEVHVPVAGAILTPAGGIALPEALDEERLVWRARSGSALEVNPRWGGPAAGPRAWWIAPGLEPHAQWRGGTLPSPSALALANEGTALFVVRRAGAVLRGWISRDAVEPRRPEPVTLKVTSTAMSSGGQVPQLVVEVGARVRPGTVWMLGPPVSRRKGVPHSRGLEHLIRALSINGETEHRLKTRDRIRRGLPPTNRESEDLADARYWNDVFDRTRRGRATRRIPFGVDGVVLEARIDRIEECGELLGWRAILVVQASPERVLPAALVLSNGLAVRDLDWLDPAETPMPTERRAWPEVDVVIEIPGFDGDTACIFGNDGETKASGTEETVWSVPGAPPRVEGPDWGSERRMRDGEWLPTNPGGPGVAVRDRWWWTIRDPAAHAAIAARECAWAGGAPPWSSRLQAALVAAGLGPPPVQPAVPTETSTDGDDSVITEQKRHISVVPSLLDGLKIRRTIEPAPLDASWGCECDAIQSSAHAYEICRVCGTAVCLRRSPTAATTSPGFQDQTLILHPWTKPAVAGMLGLSEGEFEEWLDARPWSEAVEAIEAAQVEPLARSAVRLATERRSVAALAEPLALLHAIVSGPSPPQPFLKVSEIALLPAVLAPVWEVAGAPLPVDSPLARGYSVLDRALRRLSQLLRQGALAPPWITETQRREIQRAADRLFGRAAGMVSHGEPQTLADLVGRLLPWTRPPGLRSNLPGSLRMTGLAPIDAEAPARSAVYVERHVLRPPLLARVNLGEGDTGAEPTDLERWPERAHPSTIRTIGMSLAFRGDAPTTTAVLLDDRILVMPRRPAIAGPWQNVDTWERRAALDWTLNEGGRLLMALSLEVDDDATGLHALSTLFAHLGSASDARPLRALFHTPQGSVLPEAESNAIDVLEGVMTALAPGDAPALVTARSWFVRALTGWWKVPTSVDEPTGWRYVRGAETPVGGRRGVPPAGSTAWCQLGGWLILHRPSLWFLQNRSRLDLSRWPRALRILIGVDPWPAELAVAAPRATDDSAPEMGDIHLGEVETDTSNPPSSEPPLALLPVCPTVPPTPPSATTTPDVVVYRGTLLNWLQRRPA